MPRLPVWLITPLPNTTGPATSPWSRDVCSRAEPFQKTGSDFLIFAQVSLLPSAFNHSEKAYCWKQYSLKCVYVLLLIFRAARSQRPDSLVTYSVEKQ